MIGICVRFGAPIMHRMYGLNLISQWQVGCEHMRLRSHSGIVGFGGLLLRLLALVSVKNLVFLLACNGWGVRCIALLCCTILRPFKYRCSHGSIHNWGTTFGTKGIKDYVALDLEVLS